MRLEQQPVLTQIQKLSLTPEIKQSLAILQLPAVELTNYLSQQIEENCFLEFEKDAVLESDEEAYHTDALLLEARENSPINDSEEALWEDDYPTRDLSVAAPLNNNAPQGSIPSDFTESLNIRDYLLLQLHLTSLKPDEQIIGEYLIENINNDGYLCCETDETARILNVGPAKVEQILQYIQTFEPPGIGARNITECLGAQAKGQKKSLKNQEQADLYDLALHIIENYLNEVADGQVSRITKNIHRSINDVSRAIEIIKKLDPKPGRYFENNVKPNYVFPDVIAKKVDHQFVVEVTETSSEKLRINNYYHHLLTNRSSLDPETISFLKERFRAALWLIKCLEQRKTTIQKISSAIIRVQQEFLEKGTNYLKPLTLHKISEMVGLDESTISRAISGKYIQTPHGVYAFKYFLNSSINTLQGDAVASTSIKLMIRELVNHEDPSAPMSDQNLVDVLKQRGIEISRRTITKYREELMIPDSRKRRSYKNIVQEHSTVGS